MSENKEIPVATPPAAAEPAAPAPAAVAAAPAAPAEPPKPKLADGLFREFSVGSRLAPGSSGNVMTNVKQSPMDYQKRYENSTRNQSMSAEELSKIKPETVKQPSKP